MAAKKAADARKAEMKNEIETQKEKNQEEAIFNRQYYQDMTERSEVQNMLRKLREQQTEQRHANEAKGTVLGETEEQKIAKQDSLNKSYADTIAEITSNASTLKDSYLKDYQNDLHTYYDKRREMNSAVAQMEKENSNQWGTTASNAFAAAAGAAGVAAGAASGSGGTDIKVPIETPPSTAEVIAKAPTRAAQFDAAASATTNPLEKTVYQDLAAVASKNMPAATPTATPAATPTVTPAVEYGAPYRKQNPWEIGWTK